MSDWREISGDQNLRLSQKVLEQQGEINDLKAENERLRAECVQLDEDNTGLGRALKDARAQLERLQLLLEELRKWRATFPAVNPGEFATKADGQLLAVLDRHSATDSTPDTEGALPSGSGEWLVWSVYHDAWWGPDERGYFADLARAGRYTRERAEQLCANGGARGYSADGKPGEVMVPVPAHFAAVAVGREVAVDARRLVERAIELASHRGEAVAP